MDRTENDELSLINVSAVFFWAFSFFLSSFMLGMGLYKMPLERLLFGNERDIGIHLMMTLRPVFVSCCCFTSASGAPKTVFIEHVALLANEL